MNFTIHLLCSVMPVLNASSSTFSLSVGSLKLFNSYFVTQAGQKRHTHMPVTGAWGRVTLAPALHTAGLEKWSPQPPLQQIGPPKDLTPPSWDFLCTLIEVPGSPLPR